MKKIAIKLVNNWPFTITPQKLSSPSVESREIMIDNVLKHWEYTVHYFSKKVFVLLCVYTWLYLYINLHLLNFLSKFWLNESEILKNEWSSLHLHVLRPKLFKHFGETGITYNAKIDFWLMFYVSHDVPLQSFAKVSKTHQPKLFV